MFIEDPHSNSVGLVFFFNQQFINQSKFIFPINNVSLSAGIIKVEISVNRIEI